MKTRGLFFAVSVRAALAGAAVLTPLMLSSPVAAQSNPTMTNVVPDGGEFAAQGKIRALDADASTLTLAPDSGAPVPMTVAPGVNLTDISVGDVASVHYTRSQLVAGFDGNWRVYYDGIEIMQERSSDL